MRCYWASEIKQLQRFTAGGEDSENAEWRTKASSSPWWVILFQFMLLEVAAGDVRERKKDKFQGKHSNICHCAVKINRFISTPLFLMAFWLGLGFNRSKHEKLKMHRDNTQSDLRHLVIPGWIYFPNSNVKIFSWTLVVPTWMVNPNWITDTVQNVSVGRLCSSLSQPRVEICRKVTPSGRSNYDKKC